MRDEEIDNLTADEVTEIMRKLCIPMVFGFFATIHRRSESRPNGFTDDDLDDIDQKLEDSDLVRWKQDLKDHFRKA